MADTTSNGNSHSMPGKGTINKTFEPGFWDTCDHISNRMIGWAMAGGLFGGLAALYKGRLVARQASRTALSCAMVASTLLTTERLFYHLLRFDDEFSRLLSSHVLSGVSGGSLLGLLYNGKPKVGVYAFAPLMVILGVSEMGFAEFQKYKQMEFRQQQESWRLLQQQQAQQQQGQAE